MPHESERAPERILLTGYKGFVGPHLVAACVERYPAARLFGLTHHASQRALMSAVTTADVMELEGDITDGVRLREILREARPDLIFHLAAVSSVAHSWRDPATTLSVNAGGFIQLAEAVRAEGLSPRVVVIGSGEQYGLVRPDENPVTEETLPRPVNPYAVAKVAQDLYAFQYFKAYGLDAVRARPFNHFGPGQSPDFVLASFARQIAQIEAGQSAPTLRVGNLQAQRDFLPVGDVTRAYLALAEHGQTGEAYNIGSGVVRSIESLLLRLLAMARVSIETQVDPARFRPVDTLMISVDTAKIQRDTGWRPAESLDDALRATLDYWRASVQAAEREGNHSQTV